MEGKTTLYFICVNLKTLSTDVVYDTVISKFEWNDDEMISTQKNWGSLLSKKFEMWLFQLHSVTACLLFSQYLSMSHMLVDKHQYVKHQ